MSRPETIQDLPFISKHDRFFNINTFQIEERIQEVCPEILDDLNHHIDAIKSLLSEHFETDSSSYGFDVYVPEPQKEQEKILKWKQQAWDRQNALYQKILDANDGDLPEFDVVMKNYTDYCKCPKDLLDLIDWLAKEKNIVWTQVCA